MSEVDESDTDSTNEAEFAARVGRSCAHGQPGNRMSVSAVDESAGGLGFLLVPFIYGAYFFSTELSTVD